jgi:hypothetical protein
VLPRSSHCGLAAVLLETPLGQSLVSRMSTPWNWALSHFRLL